MTKKSFHLDSDEVDAIRKLVRLALDAERREVGQLNDAKKQGLDTPHTDRFVEIEMANMKLLESIEKKLG